MFFSFLLLSVEITDFRVDGPFRRFTYLNGTLTAQIGGTYYIYAQAFFEHYPGEPSEPRNHVAFAVNGVTVSVIQPGMGGFADYGSVNTGRIVHLLKGDYISLITINPSRIWITEDHSFFGAYRVSNIPRPNPQRRTDDHEQTGSYRKTRMSFWKNK